MRATALLEKLIYRLNKSTRVRSVCHFSKKMRSFTIDHMLAIESWNMLELSFGRFVFWSFSGGNASQFYNVYTKQQPFVKNWSRSKSLFQRYFPLDQHHPMGSHQISSPKQSPKADDLDQVHNNCHKSLGPQVAVHWWWMWCWWVWWDFWAEESLMEYYPSFLVVYGGCVKCDAQKWIRQFCCIWTCGNKETKVFEK